MAGVGLQVQVHGPVQGQGGQGGHPEVIWEGWALGHPGPQRALAWDPAGVGGQVQQGHQGQSGQAYMTLVADAADIVSGEIFTPVEKFEMRRDFRCGKSLDVEKFKV